MAPLCVGLCRHDCFFPLGSFPRRALFLLFVVLALTGVGPANAQQFGVSFSNMDNQYLPGWRN